MKSYRFDAFLARAENGDLDALKALGQMYETLELSTQHVAKLIRQFRLAEKKSNGIAEYYMWLAYRDGLGVEADSKKADWYFKQSEVQGFLKDRVERKFLQTQQHKYERALQVDEHTSSGRILPAELEKHEEIIRKDQAVGTVYRCSVDALHRNLNDMVSSAYKSNTSFTNCESPAMKFLEKISDPSVNTIGTISLMVAAGGLLISPAVALLAVALIIPGAYGFRTYSAAREKERIERTTVDSLASHFGSTDSDLLNNVARQITILFFKEIEGKYPNMLSKQHPIDFAVKFSAEVVNFMGSLESDTKLDPSLAKRMVCHVESSLFSSSLALLGMEVRNSSRVVYGNQDPSPQAELVHQNQYSQHNYSSGTSNHADYPINFSSNPYALVNEYKNGSTRSADLDQAQELGTRPTFFDL